MKLVTYTYTGDFRLRIIAKNPGATGQSSSAVVNIRVMNVNDHAPEITVDYLQTREIREDLTPVRLTFSVSLSNHSINACHFL